MRQRESGLAEKGNEEGEGREVSPKQGNSGGQGSGAVLGEKRGCWV